MPASAAAACTAIPHVSPRTPAKPANCPPLSKRLVRSAWSARAYAPRIVWRTIAAYFRARLKLL
jgi:hypothetical protein